MYKILIVEDDLKISSIVKEFLHKYDYNAIIIDDFSDILNTFRRENPDLVLLDINLPTYDGFFLCRYFRKFSKAPIIIISARSGDIEQVMGMELGADDYITKPFNIDLLITKIKVILRRTYGEYASDNNNNIIYLKGLSLNESNFKISYNNREIELSKNEFKLIRKLIQNPDKIISREELLSELWDDSSFVDDNTLTVNVTRIKNKLLDFKIENAIKTKRGAGYMFISSSLDGDNIE